MLLILSWLIFVTCCLTDSQAYVTAQRVGFVPVGSYTRDFVPRLCFGKFTRIYINTYANIIFNAQKY